MHARGDTLSLDDALGMAIDAWMATDTPPPADGNAKGYQWKCLLLPDGTDIRMTVAGRTEYAVVVGDAIVYQGRSVSPRGMTLAIAGEGRNAWRDLMIRRPGDAKWLYASVLRTRIERAERQAQPQPATPADSMAAAARCMSDALRSAMVLVDHVNAQAVRQQDERRRIGSRREADQLGEDCAF
ncbi:hypothetical protein INH39_08710 [Massilia violaceinigra]|uniref:DUF2917 domain-containing protein n=1 Tax=Massilia violaceinigra TaxID=2045208 RepID=A0ABY4AAB0_9BURK|nr:hypothetical protein [Massilia violaceinigra]UOD31746.1 hypothetical protein INH39_08710 [Massilia violaceinigra]